MPQGIFFERKGRDGCAVGKWSACCLKTLRTLIILRTQKTQNNQYFVSCTLPSPLYHLRWIFPEAHLYFIGDKGEDDEGNDEHNTEGGKDAKGDLQGVSLQPQRHEVITYAKSDDGAEGCDDAVSKERATQAITVVRTKDATDGKGTALTLEVGTQEGD